MEGETEREKDDGRKDGEEEEASHGGGLSEVIPFHLPISFTQDTCFFCLLAVLQCLSWTLLCICLLVPSQLLSFQTKIESRKAMRKHNDGLPWSRRHQTERLMRNQSEAQKEMIQSTKKTDQNSDQENLAWAIAVSNHDVNGHNRPGNQEQSEWRTQKKRSGWKWIETQTVISEQKEKNNQVNQHVTKKKLTEKLMKLFDGSVSNLRARAEWAPALSSLLSFRFFDLAGFQAFYFVLVKERWFGFFFSLCFLFSWFIIWSLSHLLPIDYRQKHLLLSILKSGFIDFLHLPQFVMFQFFLKSKLVISYSN